MATLEELKNKKNKLDQERLELDKQIQLAEEEILARKRADVEQKLENLTDEKKEFILSLLQHDRSSCSDDHVANGRWTTRDGSGWRCRKCMLIEMFDGQHGGEFDFEFEVNINEVTV